MSNKSTLSIAPYYGGKSRMAHFIAERLNYDDSDVFVTPFGGMCRVLLNKPRHREECYNDFSSSLCALMSVLSDPEKAREFIHRLHEETEFSQEEFDKQKAIFDNAEIDMEVQERTKLRKFLVSNDIVSAVTANDFIEDIWLQAVEAKKIEENSRYKPVERKVKDVIKTARRSLKARILKDNDFKEKFSDQLSIWIQLYEYKDRRGFIERTLDMSQEIVSDIDLAIATYVVFQQSRDGMGKVWGEQKFKNNQGYLNRIIGLYDCAERLEGVHVYQLDALNFFRERVFVDVDTSIVNVPPQFRIMNQWVRDPRVMMYCDPSYIDPKSESKLLEGIDVHETESLSQAIKEKYQNKKMPKNLGELYAMSFGYVEQEKFLRSIQNVKCKILVSNYNLQLYDKYLNESTGWRREEFLTSTGIGNKVDNQRLEVIWYNYSFKK